MADTYWVYYRNGNPHRIVKIVDRSSAYVYEDGKWVSRQSLIKILQDTTDFEEITKEEAEQLIKTISK